MRGVAPDTTSSLTLARPAQSSGCTRTRRKYSVRVVTKVSGGRPNSWCTLSETNSASVRVSHTQ